MSTPTVARESRRRLRLWIAVIAALVVAAIPLAVNGLFASAFSDAQNGLSRVPAALVNNDSMLTTTAADGTQSVVFAGRGLVTQLTGDSKSGFDWKLTNSDQAQKGLADGTYYAVLTIPSDFSKRVSSQGTPDPQQASVSIQTDDQHGYLQGLIASTASSALEAGFGQTITAQVVGGVYSSFSTLGTQFAQAANGVGRIASGANGLASGLGQLADGSGQAAAGASDLANGQDRLTSGLGQLGGGASDAQQGAKEYASQLELKYTDNVDKLASGLGPLSEAISTNAAAVSSTQDDMATLYAKIASDPTVSKDIKDGAQAVLAKLSTAAPTGTALADTLATSAGGAAQLSGGSAAVVAGAQSLADGYGQLADGIAQSADGSAKLAAGASQLGAGLDQVTSGIQQSADGSAQLGSGATELQSGLQTGADRLNKNAFTDPKQAAETVARPLSVDTSTENKVGDVGHILATLLVPTGLWIGALAIFLLMRPLRDALLAGSASSARLVVRTFSRAGIIAAAQVVIVVGYLHLGLGVSWSSLPVTLGFTLLVSLAFVAFHQFLGTALGRVGSVISLVLLAIMLAGAGGLYPVQLLAGPFQAINAISPLSFAVDGMRAILTGGSLAPVGAGALVLAAMLLVSLLLTGIALGYRRSPLRSGWLRRARVTPGHAH